TLTPIGNPQNLFLWHLWGISFLEFIVRMLPVTVLVFGVLVLFARWAFPEDRVAVKGIEKDVYGNRGIFILSLVLMLLYVVALELRWTEFALPFLFIVYFITSRRVLLRADWLLILLFAAVFIDFHLLSGLPPVDRVVSSLSSGHPSRVFLLSAALSQLVSNVPAAVLMSKFTDKWQALAYGVNVGGNGLVIASLANLIALRLGGRRGAFGLFHRYSIPFFLITLLASCVFFFLL
ncbi:MAG: citrate transporter, partial [Candidatus Hydrothermota bacterium]